MHVILIHQLALGDSSTIILSFYFDFFLLLVQMQGQETFSSGTVVHQPRREFAEMKSLRVHRNISGCLVLGTTHHVHMKNKNDAHKQCIIVMKFLSCLMSLLMVVNIPAGSRAMSMSPPTSSGSATMAQFFDMPYGIDYMQIEPTGDAKVMGPNLGLGTLVLTGAGESNQTSSSGRASFWNQVQLKNTTANTVASFSTNITFSITTNTSYSPCDSGQGLTIFLSADNSSTLPIGGTTNGAYLGLELTNSTNNGNLSNHVFAVEVDTFMNVGTGFDDLSSCHVGVNVDSMISRNVSDMCPAGKMMCGCVENQGNYTLTVEYEAGTQILSVLLQDHMSPPMTLANMSIASFDMFQVADEFMYVGVSAATAPLSGSVSCGEVHSIYTWSFYVGPLVDVSGGNMMAGGDGGTSSNGIMKKTGVIVGMTVGAAVGLVALIVLCWFAMKDKNCAVRINVNNNEPSSVGAMKQNDLLRGPMAIDNPRVFTYKELDAMTKNFSPTERLGRGASGTVYRGTMRGDQAGTTLLVAVKRIADKSQEDNEREFLAEVSIISQIRHRNLVRLLGWCQEKGHLLLVYEYMPRGSLEKWLTRGAAARNNNNSNNSSNSSNNNFTVMAWNVRYNILSGVAAALSYLHEDWGQCILHRDVKPSNVLLDSDFNAHLGDFGLARLVEHDKGAQVTTCVAGTLGYLAPELGQTGRATTKSDVYSFGILVLEVCCGRQPICYNFPPDKIVLLDMVWAAHTARDLLSVADPELEQFHYDKGQMAIALQVGLLCCHPNPDERPSISTVRQILGGTVALPPVPVAKPKIRYSTTYTTNSGSHQQQLSFDAANSAGFPSDVGSFSSSNAGGMLSTIYLEAR